MSKLPTLLLLLLFLIPAVPLSAQNIPPELTVHSERAYKGHAQVYSAERYSDGRMAFGSLGKILFYNGEGFEDVSVPQGKGVMSIEWDEKNGRFFVGGGSLLGKLMPDSSGVLKYHSMIGLLPDSLHDFGIVWNSYCTDDGAVFFNTEDHLFRFKGDSLKVFRPENGFYEMYNPNGVPVIQDVDSGLFKIKGDEKVFLEGTRSIVKNASVRTILSSGPKEAENVWTIVTRSKGFYRYDRSKGEAVSLSEKHPDRDLQKVLKDRVYTAIKLDPDKNNYGAAYLVGTQLNGIYFISPEGRSLLHLSSEEGLPADLIWDLTRDRRGNVWASTNKGLLLLHTGSSFGILPEGGQYEGKISDIERLPARPKDQGKGPLFLSTSQGAWVREGGAFSQIKGVKRQCGDLFLYEGPKKNGGMEKSILIGAGSKGLLKATPLSDSPGGEWTAEMLFSRSTRTIDRIPDSSLAMNSDLLVVGGRDGIYLIEPSDRRKHEWQKKIGIEDLAEGIKSVAWERKGDSILIWGGMRSKGVLRIKMDRSASSHQLARYDTTDGLPEGGINIFHHPEKEKVLFGTEEGLFERKKGSFDPYCAYGKVFCNGSREVFRFKKGIDGDIWLNDVHGGEVKHLTPDGDGYRIDSLPFRYLVQLGDIRALLPERDRSWIGGNRGLVCYYPEREQDLHRPWSCKLQEVRGSKDSLLFGGHYRKKVEGAEDEWRIVNEQPEGMVPRLPFEENRLHFRYAAYFPDVQDRVRYKYKLEGFDANWSKYSKKARKEYTSLPEGAYTFRVKAKNIYGKESSTASYRFRILPPWYRTWYAYSSYGISGFGFIWLLIWLNSRRLRAQKQRLEKLVRERTKEVQEKNRNLEKANQMIQKEKEEVEKQKEKVEKKNQELEKANEIISEQKDEVEEAHMEITASIAYARKIQDALLQSEEHVSTHLPEHFVLFKPQAQVSGDFYWAREHRGYLYFAAVDCTGHGVPGAFMSMLGISQLNEIMNTEELLTPGQILTELRDRVVGELTSADPESSAKDGMDAALVKIPIPDPKSQNPKEGECEVQFAGAQNPLYVIRKGIAEDPGSVNAGEHVGATHVSPLQDDRLKPFKKTPDGIEIKGDGQPVGYDEYAKDAFTTVKLKLQKGDMLYFFSDGYADQFGGPKGKKFRYGPFKQLLAGLHEKPLEDQKRELDKTFEDWKAESEQEQIDDVVVVGVRL